MDNRFGCGYALLALMALGLLTAYAMLAPLMAMVPGR